MCKKAYWDLWEFVEKEEAQDTGMVARSSRNGWDQRSLSYRFKCRTFPINLQASRANLEESSVNSGALSRRTSFRTLSDPCVRTDQVLTVTVCPRTCRVIITLKLQLSSRVPEHCDVQLGRVGSFCLTLRGWNFFGHLDGGRNHQDQIWTNPLVYIWHLLSLAETGLKLYIVFMFLSSLVIVLQLCTGNDPADRFTRYALRFSVSLAHSPTRNGHCLHT